MTIPNIIHFCFGLQEQKTPFLFVHYVAVLSAKIVNNPDTIYMYYHYEPFGEWWDRLKPIVTLEKVDIPISIGNKAIVQTAHKADIIRMVKLIERGGVYFDIDTISYRPYADLLNNECVFAWERYPDMICNAVMLAAPNSTFMNLWFQNYYEHFVTDGWSESSIFLPATLYNKHYRENNIETPVKVLDSDYFFQPTHYDWKKIFVYSDIDIPQRLVTLHLWEQMCMDTVEKIDIKWLYDNKDILYSKLVLGNPQITDILNKIANKD
jgi:hypothetical protein